MSRPYWTWLTSLHPSSRANCKYEMTVSNFFWLCLKLNNITFYTWSSLTEIRLPQQKSPSLCLILILEWIAPSPEHVHMGTALPNSSCYITPSHEALDKNCTAFLVGLEVAMKKIQKNVKTSRSYSRAHWKLCKILRDTVRTTRVYILLIQRLLKISKWKCCLHWADFLCYQGENP